MIHSSKSHRCWDSLSKDMFCDIFVGVRSLDTVTYYIVTAHRRQNVVATIRIILLLLLITFFSPLQSLSPKTWIVISTNTVLKEMRKGGITDTWAKNIWSIYWGDEWVVPSQKNLADTPPSYYCIILIVYFSVNENKFLLIRIISSHF